MRMETEIPEKNEEDMAPTDLEWQQRVLCSDGNCIGVIGSDGHCKECGKEYEGSLAEAGLPENEESSAVENSFEKEDPSPDDMPPEAVEQDDWQNRVLCSDGNCIGVIGPDGRCKECGKPLRMTNDE
jgi:hypothetical protein